MYKIVMTSFHIPCRHFKCLKLSSFRIVALHSDLKYKIRVYKGNVVTNDMIVCNLLKTKIDYYLSKAKSNVLKVNFETLRNLVLCIKKSRYFGDIFFII